MQIVTTLRRGFFMASFKGPRILPHKHVVFLTVCYECAKSTLVLIIGMIQRINITLLLFSLSLAVWAQQQNMFTRISMDDGMGLSSNNVTSLYQDKKGFIWVGTVNGLQRFDGSKFITFYIQGYAQHQLPQSTVSQILPAGNGRLWLNYPSLKKIGIFDPSDFRFTQIPVVNTREIPPRAEYRIWIDSKGRVLLVISQYGILQYDPVSNAFTEDCFLKLPKGYTPALTIYEDIQKKQYWIPCSFKGLCLYDEQSNQLWSPEYNPSANPFLANPRINENVTEFYIDKQRRHWVFNWPVYGGGGQVKHCFDSSGTRFLTADTVGMSLVENAGYSEFRWFYEGKGGTLWIYGLNVLLNYDSAQQRMVYNKTRYIDNYGIRYDAVYQVMEDKDGSTWIATDNGLYYTRMSGNHVRNLFLKGYEQVPLSMTGITQLDNGEYWITSWGSGLITLDKTFNQYPAPVYEDMPEFSISEANDYRLTWCVLQHSKSGKVFIGCQSGHLMIYDTMTRRTAYINDTAFGGGTINTMAEDNKGNIWFGTQGGRLVKWDGKQFSIVQRVRTIIYKILIDRQELIWLGCHEKGLYAVDAATGNILQHYTVGTGEKNLFSATVYDIEQLDDHTICAAAEALNIVNKKTGKVEQVTIRNGLPSNTAKRLQLDRDGYLWIVTSNGLCRYDHRNKRFTPYGIKDGILTFELADVAEYMTKDGTLLFGVKNQVSFFHPSIFYSSAPPPDVVITDFRILSQFYPVDSLMALPAVHLTHDLNSITFYFASLSYKEEDKLTYYYKLDGRDKDWIRADRSLMVNYTQLPPGNYTFQVWCENREGQHSEHITSFSFTIKPPFWKTGWFVSTLLMMIAMIIYSMHWLRLNRLLAVEKVRNRVARDLHDDMGSTLSTINILSSMAKAKMNTDIVKTAEYINKISDNSQRMMEAMDDIVWSIKPANDSMQKVVARMREFATSVLEAKDIEMEFGVDENVLDAKLDMEARRDIFLVFKEAVNNAAKYSRCSKTSIRMYIQHRELVMDVADDGAGFDVKNADSGNGLGNMQKRADALRGKIEITSSQGNGTLVQLRVPLNK